MNLRSSIERRLARLDALQSNPFGQLIELEVCRRDVVHWFNAWCWTYNPKNVAARLPAHVPFDLFPRQEEMLRWIDARMAAREDGLIEKSREIGFTWLAGGYALHGWLFTGGFKATFGSRGEALVDRMGDPDSILEKIRMLYRGLPAWMMPPQFVPAKHDNHLRIINPDTESVIRGEAGDQMGRGGRSTIYFIDEAAFIERADRVEAATSANTDVRIWGSTVNGMGNLFARKRHGGGMRPDQIFRFHWTDDPRKAEGTVENPETGQTEPWSVVEKRRLEAHVWASEYDIDYSASVEGIFIPAKWVQSCQAIGPLLEQKGIKIVPSVHGVAGQDVGAGGSGKSVFVARFGPVVKVVRAWGDPDTIETAHRAMEECGLAAFTRDDGYDCKIGVLFYDSVGVGVSLVNTFQRVHVPGLMTEGINTGQPPSDTMWPDGQTSAEKFGNLKGELWSIMRERAKCTHEMYLHLAGEEGGQEHPVDELMILPSGPETQTLVAQLSSPKRERTVTGKIVVESKKAMAARGLPSPDHADALALSYTNTGLDVWAKLAAA